MGYLLLADMTVLLHVGFVCFVVFGGLLAVKWRPVVWLHLPAVAWGAVVEFAGWICPLTPLENWFRERAGAAGYQTDFIAHYLLPILYPADLTREVQIMLGIVVLVINVAVYGWLWRNSRTG